MNLWTQIYLTWNIIHLVLFLSLLVSGFWIFQKKFEWCFALKKSIQYYLLMRVLFMSILLFQELF